MPKLRVTYGVGANGGVDICVQGKLTWHGAKRAHRDHFLLMTSHYERVGRKATNVVLAPKACSECAGRNEYTIPELSVDEINASSAFHARQSTCSKHKHTFWRSSIHRLFDPMALHAGRTFAFGAITRCAHSQKLCTKIFELV